MAEWREPLKCLLLFGRVSYVTKWPRETASTKLESPTINSAATSWGRNHPSRQLAEIGLEKKLTIERKRKSALRKKRGQLLGGGSSSFEQRDRAWGRSVSAVFLSPGSRFES